MNLQDFIGKTVLDGNRRFALYRITSPEISVVDTRPDANGCYTHYAYATINGDPISTGILRFEDPALKEPFLAAYKAYCRTQDAYLEEYGYWLRRD